MSSGDGQSYVLSQQSEQQTVIKLLNTTLSAVLCLPTVKLELKFDSLQHCLPWSSDASSQ